LPWTGASTPARSIVLGTLALIVALSWAEGPARAQTLAARPDPTLAEMVREAAQRFGIPERWITSVMRVESAFDARATSAVGAMGLMQVMPQTYAGLRLRYGLGADPYHPHDNILAGAAYLREMYDRYGAAGFLAAYNAGPGRYEAHLIGGRPLPLETRAYVAKIAPRLDDDVAEIATARSLAPPQPTLFVPVGVRSADTSAVTAAPAIQRATAASSPLFATLTAREPGR
jgi:soluble lytic murein transglycosylase-like protein